jgi:hypothetical protein
MSMMEAYHKEEAPAQGLGLLARPRDWSGVWPLGTSGVTGAFLMPAENSLAA